MQLACIFVPPGSPSSPLMTASQRDSAPDPSSSRAADPHRVLDMRPIVTPGPWDRIADGYTAFLADALSRYAADALDLSGLVPGERVLDVATGPGTLARLAARITQVHALDFSQAMLDALERHARPEELRRLSLHCGDGQNLPFPDDAFDVGYSMFGLFLFPDRARALAELARVIRPGGRVVVGSWQAQDQVPALRLILEELRRHMPSDFEPPPAPLSHPAAVKSEMTAAGFEVEVHSVTHAIETDSLDALWEGLRRSHVALDIAEAQLDGPRYAELLQRIRDRLERELGPGPQRVAMPAWLGLGRLPQISSAVRPPE
jgi:ubiquinone/menaquinone biosynthesis C-methylase UbiE